MKNEITTTKTETFDWRAFDALTEEQVHAAALADPDAQPLTQAQLARMKRVPFVRPLRFRLKISQEEFAARFHIPIGTLRDWEQGRAKPDQTAMAYLQAIAGDAAAVQQALENAPKPPQQH